MEINLVKNTHLLNVGFNSNRKLEDYAGFINMDDSQLKLLAHARTFDKEENKRTRNSIVKMLFAVPFVDSISRGLTIHNIARPDLSKILSKTGKTAGVWALGLSFVALYQAAESKIAANNPPLQKFKKEHPLLDLVADLTIILTGFSLCREGFNALKNKVNIDKIDKFKILEKVKNAAVKTKDTLDATAFNKQVLPKIYELTETFAKASPNAHGAGKMLICWTAPILFVSAIAKSMLYSKNQAEKVQQNYADLKNKQFKAAKHLSNVLSAERDILSQTHTKSSGV